MVSMADVPLVEAVRMITRTPARILEVPNTKGSLAAGMDADVVIFDQNIRVEMTMIGGKVVYESGVIGNR